MANGTRHGNPGRAGGVRSDAPAVRRRRTSSTAVPCDAETAWLPRQALHAFWYTALASFSSVAPCVSIARSHGLVHRDSAAGRVAPVEGTGTGKSRVTKVIPQPRMLEKAAEM